MAKTIATAFATMSVIFGLAIGYAGPAAADEWTMPDVTGELLQDAVSDVQSVAGDAKLNFTYDTGTSQTVYNMANWAVCETTPSAGDEIPQDSKEVDFSLRRLNEEC